MIKGKLKRKLYFLLGAILSHISVCIPKQENVIFFFSTSTLYDNSEALFHYLIEQGYHHQYRIICAVRDKNLCKKIYNVRYISVFGAIWPILRSKYVFYHNEMLPIMPTSKQIFVDFWHASTFKKINKMIEPDYKYDFFTYLTVTSELFRPIFAEAFGCDKNRIILNGHPRNDYLYKNIDSLKRLQIDKNHFKKIFIWVPTYRLSKSHKQRDAEPNYFMGSGLPVFRTESALEELNSFLDKNSCFLIIKIHPAQDCACITHKTFSNIKFLYNLELETMDIPFYSILPDMDALITDYSSIVFDFLLLNRPMAFTLDDYETYKRRRGFVFSDPLEFMPGEQIMEAKDFYRFLQHCLNNEDNYKQQRMEINNRVNLYKNGGNCQRILEFVGIYK